MQISSSKFGGSRPSGERPDASSVSIAGADAVTMELIARMRSGDREAAALFIQRNGDLIRRRYRRKLGVGMRRLFDSMELLSTISRRLDRYVLSNALRAQSEAQVWSLVFTIAEHSMADKARVLQRLQRTEGPDSEFAIALSNRISQAEHRTVDGGNIELDAIFQSLGDRTDRTLLADWLRGVPCATTADQMHMTEAAVRKRHQRIRETLRKALSKEPST